MVGVTSGHSKPGTGWRGGPKPLPLQGPAQKLRGKGQEGGDGLGMGGGSVWPATASQEGHQEQGQYPGPPMGAGLSAHR